MRTRISNLLETALPVLLGPMRAVTYGEMAAHVSNAGGFGQIAASGLSGDRLQDEIRLARSLTDKPFGVNVPLYRPNAMEAVEIAAALGVRAITTSAGDPAKIIAMTRAAGMTVLHKVSSVAMARKAQAAGVDGVIATGHEAGGHIGRGDTTTFALVPQLIDAVDIPVVAAGGICDGRTLAAALALGAEGVEVGSRFLATSEAPVAGSVKQALVDMGDEDTLVLGRGAMPIRALKNPTTLRLADPDRGKEHRQLDRHGEAAYLKVQDGGVGLVPCGQNAGLIHEIYDIRRVLSTMVDEARIALELSLALYEGEPPWTTST